MYLARARRVDTLDRVAGEEADAPRADAPRAPVRGNVVALGFTSLFTDVSSEMVAAILPLYLTFTLQLSPLEFGIFDGLYQAIGALVALMLGVRADARRRHKELAGTGYAISAGSRLAMVVAAGQWLPLTGALYADRVGKGIRTAPRDALISLSAPPRRLAESFALHRSLDTIGALTGPLIAFAILSEAPRAYDAVFVTSFFAAVIGLSILVLFVRRPAIEMTGEPRQGMLTPAFALLRLRSFRRVVCSAALIGLFTLSDSFLYLAYARQGSIDTRWFPLLFVGAPIVYLVLAMPVGRLADRSGPGRVFVVGNLLLAGSYLAVALPTHGTVQLLSMLVLLGAYLAAVDGVLAALASSHLPRESRATGLAIIAAVVTGTNAIAAVAFGWMWSNVGPKEALIAFAGLTACATLAAGLLLWPRHREPATS